jgi:hypothetical protein
MVVDLIRSRAALRQRFGRCGIKSMFCGGLLQRNSFSAIDRLIFVGLYQLFPNARDALAIVRPDTIVRWHRAGFRSYWRWKCDLVAVDQWCRWKYAG